MNSTTRSSRILLFPSCDRDGLLLGALAEREEGPATRADAMLFGWMLGLDASIDAVGAARAVLAVATQRGDLPRTDYQRALVEGLQRFVTDRGRVASLSTSAGVRPRHRWRVRGTQEDEPAITARKSGEEACRDAPRGSDEQIKTGR